MQLLAHDHQFATDGRGSIDFRGGDMPEHGLLRTGLGKSIVSGDFRPAPNVANRHDCIQAAPKYVLLER